MASSVLAIDLGTYSVKIVVVNPGFRHAAVVDVIERAVPAGDRADALTRSASVMRQVLQERGINGDDDMVFAAVPGNMVSNRILEFGFRGLKRAELDKVVGGELEGLLPYDMEEMVYTFDSLPRDLGVDKEASGLSLEQTDDDEPTFVRSGDVRPPLGAIASPATGMRVFACAMQQDRARNLLEMLSVQGQAPRGLIVGVTGFARIVERVATLAPVTDQGQSVALIDMGHQRTDVCVVNGGRVVFARTIERGGRDVTEVIARAWNIPFEEAEKAKHADGVIGSSDEPVAPHAFGRVHDVVMAELDPLARDLRRTFKACRAETGASVATALAVGGGSRLRGIASYLSEQLGLPVSTLSDDDAVALLGSDLFEQGVRADTACLAAGVALDGAAGGVMFDLRQGPLAFRADFSFLRQKLGHIGIAILCITFAVLGSVYASFYKLRKNEVALMERLALETRALKGREMSAEEVFEAMGPAQAAELSPLPKMSAWDILLAINDKLPAKTDVILDVKSIDISAGGITMEAQAATTEQVSALRKSLESIKCFESVSKANISSGANDVKDFSLRITSRCM